MKNYVLIIFILSILLLGCKKKNQPTAREIALQDYQTNYLGSEVATTGWTGNTANCNAGAPQSSYTYSTIIFKP